MKLIIIKHQMNMKCHKLSPTAFSPMEGVFPHEKKKQLCAFLPYFCRWGAMPTQEKKNYTYIIFLKYNTAPQF